MSENKDNIYHKMTRQFYFYSVLFKQDKETCKYLAEFSLLWNTARHFCFAIIVAKTTNVVTETNIQWKIWAHNSLLKIMSGL